MNTETNHGVTEGNFGSPIYNQNHHIVGTLFELVRVNGGAGPWDRALCSRLLW